MFTNLTNVPVFVKGYDEAVKRYTEVLGLELRMNGSMGGDYQLIAVGVSGQDDISIVLRKPHKGTLYTPQPPSPYRKLPSRGREARPARHQDHTGTGRAALGLPCGLRKPIRELSCLCRAEPDGLSTWKRGKLSATASICHRLVGLCSHYSSFSNSDSRAQA